MARGRFLLYLPQDATPVGSGWLDALLLPFDDPAVAGVYGRQLPRDDASAMERFFLLNTYSPRHEVRRVGRHEDSSLARCFFSTVGGAIRASLWQQHPFSEAVIMSEDQAWSKEVMAAGHAIAYQPAAQLLHSHHYGIGAIFRRNFDSGYSIHQIFAGRTGISPRQALSRLAQEAVFVLRSGRPRTYCASRSTNAPGTSGSGWERTRNCCRQGCAGPAAISGISGTEPRACWRAE